jgi:DNA-binding transcriptional LysR family regulator
MKLDQLKYFLAVAKHQHIGKAATASAISASAISHSISALELEFSCKLLVKQGRRIQLTDDGQRLAQYAKQLMAQADNIQQKMTTCDTQLQGHYRLGATHGYSEQWLTPAWLSLQTQHERLSAEILSLRSHDVTQKILAGELDLGLCLAPHTNPEFNSKTILSDPMVLAFRHGHPLKERITSDNFNALNDHPAAMAKSYQSITNCETHPMFEHYHVKVDTQFIYDSYYVAVAALEHSDLWTLLPTSVVNWYADTLDYVKPNFKGLDIQVKAIWPKHQVLTGATYQLLELLMP